MDMPRLEASKDYDMKKKLLVLLIAASSMLMPNLASAVAIDVEDLGVGGCEPLAPWILHCPSPP